MSENKQYNPFRLLSDVHLTEDMSCCTDTYLLDRSTMKHLDSEGVSIEEEEAQNSKE